MMIKDQVQLVCVVLILINRSLTNAELFNIALNKPTFQSGTLQWPDANHRWLSEHAVDGNKNCPSPADSQYYSGTAVLDTPWWQVDLGMIFTIEKVVVYGQPHERPPQLKGFRLYITRENSTNTSDLTYENTENYENGIFSIKINTSSIHHQGRYLTIVLPMTTFTNRYMIGPLVLCEVEIFTQECPDGSYGWICNESCGHCASSTHCNMLNGSCPAGCKPGFIGDICKTKCPSRSFGFGCNQTCHCINNSDCNPISGFCDKIICEPGWQGSSCSQECSAGTFGPGCQSSCHCLDGSCHHINGTCDIGSCEPGWLGSKCALGPAEATETGSRLITIVASVIAAVVIVLVASLVVFVMCRRRVKAKDKPDDIHSVYTQPDFNLSTNTGDYDTLEVPHSQGNNGDATHRVLSM